MTAYLPSPTVGVFMLGPLPVRMYALCILIGIVLAIWLTGRRLVPRGDEPGQALDVGAWAVLFGIVGGRLYHVITTPGPYWGPDGNPMDALKVWEGGLGIWGAVALGALGAWIGCRRHGVSFLAFADAAAPGVAFAQAIGRFGNWFNNELYGGPTTLPWGLEIHEWDQSAGRAVVDAAGKPVLLGVFHPTFLYEAVFLVLLGVGLLVVDRRVRPRAGPDPRALRGRLPGRPDRHRDDAHRRGPAHPRPAAQRLDEHRRVPPRGLDLLVHRPPARGPKPSRWANQSPRMWDSPAQMARRRGPGIFFRHVARAVRA